MKKHFEYRTVLLVILFTVFATSCKKKEEIDEFANVRGNYFSIRQFALDEWNTFAGEPFTIIKSVRVDNKTDSSFTNSDTLNWAPIFEVFLATDISKRSFLGKYNFNQFDDNVDGTHNFFYQAKDKDLFTQKLLITIDQYSMKVRGIYIETIQHGFWDEVTQKLYYKPMKTIQIQRDERPRMGSKKFTVLQYDFMR